MRFPSHNSVPNVPVFFVVLCCLLLYLYSFAIICPHKSHAEFTNKCTFELITNILDRERGRDRGDKMKTDECCWPVLVSSRVACACLCDLQLSTVARLLNVFYMYGMDPRHGYGTGFVVQLPQVPRLQVYNSTHISAHIYLMYLMYPRYNVYSVGSIETTLRTQ